MFIYVPFACLHKYGCVDALHKCHDAVNTQHPPRAASPVCDSFESCQPQPVWPLPRGWAWWSPQPSEQLMSGMSTWSLPSHSSLAWLNHVKIMWLTSCCFYLCVNAPFLTSMLHLILEPEDQHDFALFLASGWRNSPCLSWRDTFRQFTRQLLCGRRTGCDFRSFVVCLCYMCKIACCINFNMEYCKKYLCARMYLSLPCNTFHWTCASLRHHWKYGEITKVEIRKCSGTQINYDKLTSLSLYNVLSFLCSISPDPSWDP